MSLILHSGGQEVTREQLLEVETPKGSGSWHPLPHHDVLESVCRTLRVANYEVAKETLAVSKEGKRFFGTLDLTTKIGKSETLSIGVRNSHDKSFSIGFCCGTRTFVCDNLSFSADIVIAKKHTRFGRDRFQEGIISGVRRLASFADSQAELIRDLQLKWVSKEEAESLILCSAEKDIIGWQTLPKVLNEWRNPSHEEHRISTRYGLLQAFTEVLKPRFKTQPIKAAYETIQLTNFLVTSC